MARSRVSARTIRNLAPVLIPLVTKVAIPMALKSMRRSTRDGLSDVLGEAGDRFDRNLKKTRSELEDVRDEAVDRGRQLYEDALKHGADLLEMIATKGVGAAEDWAQTIIKPRRRFPWGKVLAATAVLGVGFLVLTRD